MELAEVLKALERYTPQYPKEVVEAAVSMQEQITPELLRILEDTVTRAVEISAQDPDQDCYAHMYALFLLAQFRETRAYPFVVGFARLSEDVLESLVGDAITEEFPRILASVCDGDLGPIKALIEDPALYEYARDAALISLTVLVAEGALHRDEVMAYFKSLFEGKLERKHSAVWDSLVAVSVDLYPEEVVEQIVAAYAEGLADPGFMNPRDVDRALKKGKEVVLGKFAKHAKGYIRNTVDEMKWWACFNEPIRPVHVLTSPANRTPHSSSEHLLKPVRQEPKIGRNDPCPCGSGKKYKKCCLAAE